MVKIAAVIHGDWLKNQSPPNSGEIPPLFSRNSSESRGLPVRSALVKGEGSEPQIKK